MCSVFRAHATHTQPAAQSTAAALRGWLAIRNPRMTTATMLAVLGVLLSVSGMLDLLASKSNRALPARGRFMFVDGCTSGVRTAYSIHTKSYVRPYCCVYCCSMGMYDSSQVHQACLPLVVHPSQSALAICAEHCSRYIYKQRNMPNCWSKQSADLHVHTFTEFRPILLTSGPQLLLPTTLYFMPLLALISLLCAYISAV